MAKICKVCGDKINYDEENDIFTSHFGYDSEIWLTGFSYDKDYRRNLCAFHAIEEYENEMEEDDFDYGYSNDYDDEEEDLA